MLEVSAIDTFYGETQALFGLSLSVGSGEVVALLGPNGAGKTTTIRSILGLTRPRRGDIASRVARSSSRPTHEIARVGIGWVPDDRRLFPTLTVARNLALGMQAARRFRAWIARRDVRTSSRRSKYLMWRECENLSGGEMQMVAIARALLGSPGLVLFDEPSQGLAPKIVDDVIMSIRRLKGEGISALIVEQNAEVALGVADRVVVLSHGQVAWSGEAASAESRSGASSDACWGA